MTVKITTQVKTIKELYDERKHLSKNHLDTCEINTQIDKVLGRITPHKQSEKVVSSFNGIGYEDILKGGIFESEHGKFKVTDIEGHRIKINGNWYHKAKFEPAIVTKFKGRLKSNER